MIVCTNHLHLIISSQTVFHLYDDRQLHNHVVVQSVGLCHYNDNWTHMFLRIFVLFEYCLCCSTSTCILVIIHLIANIIIIMIIATCVDEVSALNVLAVGERGRW